MPSPDIRVHLSTVHSSCLSTLPPFLQRPATRCRLPVCRRPTACSIKILRPGSLTKETSDGCTVERNKSTKCSFLLSYRRQTREKERIDMGPTTSSLAFSPPVDFRRDENYCGQDWLIIINLIKMFSFPTMCDSKIRFRLC